MMKVRQDAWSEEDDLLLAETVLRHIREGSTQLKAFDEVGDALNRTSAACGFRWNAVVRDKYDDAIKLAKKHRKDRKRQLAYQSKPVAAYSAPQQPEPQLFKPAEAMESASVTPTVASVTPTVASVTPPPAAVTEEKEITLKDVIRFLQKMSGNGYQESLLKQENEALKLKNNELTEKVKNLEAHLNKLQEEHQIIEEDYQSIIQIMNRARRMALLEEEPEEHHSPKFRMDKNGNLEKIAK
ncbi:RsfA family transcriptional regulator [Evansella sp. LMS18]|uniref:RsfA family transcriptional regulator n=1 Tax=Evansella sp. LMS18 TaxID=2924033 RepID=UPI0020D0209E|nr:RsfA family transcriptional regulator [Evansella sp. LMS18]UTR13005.1 RsfA family transcriptional regulator [Evansella sp. LMS18]